MFFFSTSVVPCQCHSTDAPYFILTLLSSKGQEADTWELSNKTNSLLDIGGILDRKRLSAFGPFFALKELFTIFILKNILLHAMQDTHCSVLLTHPHP
jgi:hypothetical protein